VADTDSLRELGLVGRKSLGKNEAMLFVFDKSGRYGWWAKGMLFSTDIVWIDEGGLIVEIERDVSPKSYPKSFINTLNSKYVLEMNAGQVQALGMYVGLKINIPE
jgi:uncharacterized membrane protein (UPF0127 family)